MSCFLRNLGADTVEGSLVPEGWWIMCQNLGKSESYHLAKRGGMFQMK